MNTYRSFLMSQEQVTPLSYAQPPQQSSAREGFLLRFCAGLIDGAFCFLPGIVLTLVAAKLAGAWFAGVFVTLVYVGYSSLEIFKAATPGKMLLKLKITNEDGSDADRKTLIKRWAIKQIPQFANFVAAVTAMAIFGWFTTFCVIGYIISCCLTFRPDRQALHDTFAHTAVFRTQTAAAAMPTPAEQPQRQAA
jgi:uncharacterized RDD family membrane protein YckC